MSTQVQPAAFSRRRINLGCGYDIRPDYLNVDLHASHGPDLVADITKLEMLQDGCADEVVAQDVLEHLERHKVQPALREWARLLSENGVIHVRVPSLEHMFKMLCLPENRIAANAEKIIHLMYGTQAYTGDYHLSGFTAATLESHLEQAGLRICDAKVLDNWLFDVSARKCQELSEPAEFVKYAYFKILGRPVDADGFRHFYESLRLNTITKEGVLNQLERSEEANFLKAHPSYLL